MELSDKNFIGWEGDVFGFGYGTGEQYTLKALKDFMKSLKSGIFSDDLQNYAYIRNLRRNWAKRLLG
jgi:hypothetical protein